ncbi:MAG: trypsin-like serine protease [Alphaproteobacteria bacterium]|nr:trypsin-like serine protease [Alphaproteobacteria bacterium]
MRLIPLIGLTVAMTACDGAGRNDVAPVADAAASVVYGTDNRLDYYQVSDPRCSPWPTPPPWSSPAPRSPTCRAAPRASRPGTYGGHNSLCSSEPFYSQPDPGYCTAFMVGPDTVATAGHCVSSSDCSSTKFVFGFRMNSASSARTTVDDNDVYSCSSIVAAPSRAQDYAVVRVDPHDRRRHRDGRAQQRLGHQRHPARAARPPQRPADQDRRRRHPSATPPPPATSRPTSTATAATAARPWSTPTRCRVEGILVRGNTDFVRSGSCLRIQRLPRQRLPRLGGREAKASCGSARSRAARRAARAPRTPTRRTTPSCGAPLGNGTFPNLQVCASDDDWYALDVTSGVPVSITATFTHSASDIDIQPVEQRHARGDQPGHVELREPSPTRPRPPARSTCASTATTAPSREQLRARHAGGTGATSGCADDSFEDNDAIGSAARSGHRQRLRQPRDLHHRRRLVRHPAERGRRAHRRHLLQRRRRRPRREAGTRPGGTRWASPRAPTTPSRSPTRRAPRARSTSRSTATRAPPALQHGAGRRRAAHARHALAHHRRPADLGDVTGATGGASVTLVAGRSGGTTNVPGCAGVTVPIAAPVVVGSASANVGGAATISRVDRAGTSAAGRTYDFVAVELSTCTVSNVVTTASF